MLRAVRWDVRRFATLGSTNDWLLAAARDGADEGLVAVARHQTAGRGRLGRRWEGPPGSGLLVSVLLRPTAPAGTLYAATAAVALAAADACRAAGVVAGIKWPNDLVVPVEDGSATREGWTAKLAGILAESDPGAPGGRPGSVAVVVGVGLNVGWAPEGATSLLARINGAADGGAPGGDGPGVGRPGEPAGDRVGRLAEEVLDAFLGALGGRVPAIDSAEGRAGILDELRDRCVTTGRAVRVELGDGTTVVGTAARVDATGRLVVATGEPGEGGPGGPGGARTPTGPARVGRTGSGRAAPGGSDPGPGPAVAASREVAVAAGDVVHLRPLAGRPG